jgi:hypothetical protein
VLYHNFGNALVLYLSIFRLESTHPNFSAASSHQNGMEWQLPSSDLLDFPICPLMARFQGDFSGQFAQFPERAK